MLNADGTPYTAHTTNPVPFILIDQNYKHLKYQINPTVGNIAPTILTLLNIEKPQEMKNRGLIEKRLLEEEHV
jgi:2,3-bisphosphoglycerate-independent phosphoglycerate mutase